MKLRGLDIDDLIILVMMADGISVTDIGKRMHLTQPAISQRLSKIRNLTGVCVAYRAKKYMAMTANGLVLAVGAKEALLTLLRSLPDAFSHGRSDSLVHYLLSKRGDWAAHERHDA